jgi:hypothetical protein
VGVETILYLDDRLHESVTTTTLAASSVANGFSKDAVRRTDWKTAWKPSDGAGDEYLEANGGSQTWLGSTGGDDIAVALAYDARGCDQDEIQLVRESAEGSGIWTSSPLAFTINKSGPTVDIQTFNLSSGGRTKYRLYQYASGRSGAATKTCRIFGWSMYAVAGYHTIGTDDSNATGAGGLRLVAHTGIFRALTGQVATNQNAAASQAFDLPFQPGTETLFEKLRDEFFARGGPGRAFYIQFQGLENPAKANVGMVRLDGRSYGGSRSVRDEYDIGIPLKTEVFV